MANKAIIAGASGLIGDNLLQQLLQQPKYDSVLVLVRKQLPISHQKLSQVVVDFENLDNYKNLLNGHAVFCCLGTTQSNTPDKSVYRAIDHDYPVKLAQLAAANGVKQYHLISAIGANAASGNFYLRTKGEAERDVEAAGVDTLHIYRPSLLVGDRQEKRLVETIGKYVMKVIDPLLVGRLKKYRSIKATTVARAMINASLTNKTGVFIHPTDKIKELA